MGIEYDAPARVKARTKPSRGFPAKWPGQCRTCRCRFSKGDIIQFNVYNQLVHCGGCPSKRRSPDLRAAASSVPVATVRNARTRTQS